MKNEKIFEDSTKRFGGRLKDLSNTENRDLENFEFILKNYNSRNYFTNRSFKPIVNYISNPYLNATAMITNEDKPIIGIYAGSRIIMFDLFLRLMSYNSILDSVGNSSLEKIKEPTIRNYYRDASKFSEFAMLDYEKYKAAIPLDKERKSFAFFLTHLAMEFIFEHELAHHTNGHLFYLINNFDLRKISLFDDEGISDKSLVTFQTLEMDADATAIVRVATRIIEIFKTKKFASMKSEGNTLQFYDNVYDSISSLMFSVFNFFIVMDNDVIDNNEEYKYKHPPARLRSLMVVSTLIENIRISHPEIDLSLMKKKLAHVFREAIHAKEKLTGISLDDDIFDSEIYANHKLPKYLLDRWRVIRPELSLYSIVKLAP